jgi:ribonuclease HI
VLNRDLWERLDRLTSARGPRAIAWHYVRGHVGIPGNERVDTIADAFAVGQPVALYDGPLLAYSVPLMDLPDDTAVPVRKPGSEKRSKGAAYAYLSVVDGKPMRHATWTECEQRVKGRSGARFKKAMSAAEQEAILRSWSFTPDDV